MLINQPYGFRGHPEEAKGVLQGGEDMFQDLDGLELQVYFYEFRNVGEFKKEFSPSSEVLSMVLRWVSQ